LIFSGENFMAIRIQIGPHSKKFQRNEIKAVATCNGNAHIITNNGTTMLPNVFDTLDKLISACDEGDELKITLS
jgi:hypothetical protein